MSINREWIKKTYTHTMEYYSVYTHTHTHKHTHTHSHTMEYYLAIKRNEIMSFAATWMALENIILSEIRERKTNII